MSLPLTVSPVPLMCGAKVVVGDDIHGEVEEVIYSRGMSWPVYLVEYWLDGQIVSRRFHHLNVVPL